MFKSHSFIPLLPSLLHSSEASYLEKKCSSLLLTFNLLVLQSVWEDDAYIINMVLFVIVTINPYELFVRCTSHPAGTKRKSMLTNEITISY